MKIKNVLGAALVIASIGLVASSPVLAVGCPKGSVRGEGTEVSTLAECNVKQDDSLMPTITNIINVIIGVLGVVAVIVIILGGFQYLTSTGDPGKIKKAKDTILYGVIGLVVAILAFAIVNFVLSSVTSTPAAAPADDDDDTSLVPTPDTH